MNISILKSSVFSIVPKLRSLPEVRNRIQFASVKMVWSSPPWIADIIRLIVESKFLNCNRLQIRILSSFSSLREKRISGFFVVIFFFLLSGIKSRQNSIFELID